MFSSINSAAPRPSFYSDIEQMWPEYYSKDVMRKIFENKAFQENPYQFTLINLIDGYYTNSSCSAMPAHIFMKSLPNFKENATIDLVKKIAQERFKDHPQSQQILQAFNSSVNDSNFLTHFELYKDTNYLYDLNALLRNVFNNAREEKILLIDEEYLAMQEHANSLE